MTCRVCGQGPLSSIFDGGMIPRCFDYQESSATSALNYAFSAVQCQACGVIQLLKAISADELKPSYDWVKNKEPDSHAQQIASIVIDRLEENESRALFISPFDYSCFRFVRRAVGSRAVMMDLSEDIAIDQEYCNQAQIQSKLTAKRIEKIKTKYGKFDVLITCRLLEHAEHPGALVGNLTKLLTEKGRLIVEVPDSTKSLLLGDISMLWEEHLVYFTPSSLQKGFETTGLSLETFYRFSYSQEDAMAGVFYVNENSEYKVSAMCDLFVGNWYGKTLASLNELTKSELVSLTNEFGKLAILGAGHRAIMFINLLRLGPYIECVIDDAPEKQGLYMPGSGLEIVRSDEAARRSIGVILLAVGINIELRIIEALNGVFDNSVYFLSVSPDSPRSLRAFKTLYEADKG